MKAICLGAKAVGLGRPFLYAQSVSCLLHSYDYDSGVVNLHCISQAYGAAGVSKMIEILAREITTAMRLVGASSIDSLRPEMVRPVY